MQANAVPFIAAGLVDADAMSVVGICYTGFSAVIVHNGLDATGDVVLVGGGPGTYGLNYELLCDKGVFIEATGTGKGTVWIAG